MNILAIDTSSKFLSLAVQKAERIVARTNLNSDRRLSNLLIPSIDGILKRARIDLKDLDGFTTGVGPGSFTGLRIGITTIKALAFSLDKPIVGISSLDIIARGISRAPFQICSIVDAKRDNVFSCIYELKNGQLKRISKYLLINIRDLLKRINKPTIFTGDGLSVFADLIKKEKRAKAIFAKQNLWYPNASSLLSLALQGFKKKRFIDAGKLVPLYLYPKECQIKTRKR